MSVHDPQKIINQNLQSNQLAALWRDGAVCNGGRANLGAEPRVLYLSIWMSVGCAPSLISHMIADREASIPLKALPSSCFLHPRELLPARAEVMAICIRKT